MSYVIMHNVTRSLVLAEVLGANVSSRPRQWWNKPLVQSRQYWAAFLGGTSPPSLRTQQVMTDVRSHVHLVNTDKYLLGLQPTISHVTCDVM